jgi:hypothetical protein
MPKLIYNPIIIALIVLINEVNADCSMPQNGITKSEDKFQVCSSCVDKKEFLIRSCHWNPSTDICETKMIVSGDHLSNINACYTYYHLSDFKDELKTNMNLLISMTLNLKSMTELGSMGRVPLWLKELSSHDSHTVEFLVRKLSSSLCEDSYRLQNIMNKITYGMLSDMYSRVGNLEFSSDFDKLKKLAKLSKSIVKTLPFGSAIVSIVESVYQIYDLVKTLKGSVKTALPKDQMNHKVLMLMSHLQDSSVDIQYSCLLMSSFDPKTLLLSNIGYGNQELGEDPKSDISRSFVCYIILKHVSSLEDCSGLNFEIDMLDLILIDNYVNICQDMEIPMKKVLTEIGSGGKLDLRALNTDCYLANKK